MELVIRKADLLRELQLLQGIVERKNTIPILANILLEAGASGVKLLATDLDIAMRSACEASVDKEGTLTLPARKLFEIVKALPETDVRIAEDKNGVKVAADRFESRMSTLPAEDFPSVPTGAGEGAAETLPGMGLRQMVAKTQFAITGEDTRYFLNGGLLVLRQEAMSLVATDGHRLAMVTVEREDTEKGKKKADGGDGTRVILPKKTLLELGRLLGESGEPVTFTKSENHLFFASGGRTLVSRVIDGQFPAYERVIPRNSDKRIEFDRDRLASAVRRVALLSNERSRAVRFQFDEGQVEVNSSSQEFGDAREVIAVEYPGPSVQICFNASYVIDFLGAVETEKVVLEFKDEVSQALMRPIAAEGYDYLYVIMPMRV